MTPNREKSFAIFSVLALLSKTNGIILYPFSASYEYIKTKKIKIFTQSNLVLVLGLLFSFGYTLYSRDVLTDENLIIGNTDTIPSQYQVGNSLKNFLCFDAESFIAYPDIGMVVDDRGRQCFWNFLLKTSLVMERDIEEPFHQNLSRILSGLFLIVLLVSAAGIKNAWKENRNTFWILSLNTFWFILGLIVIRILKPMGAANDFRYVFPIVPSIAVFTAYGVMSLRKQSYLRKILLFGVYVFVFLSAVYYSVALRR